MKNCDFPLDCIALKCYDGSTEFEWAETTRSHIWKEGYST